MMMGDMIEPKTGDVSNLSLAIATMQNIVTALNGLRFLPAYPSGAIPITAASGNKANAVATATLAALSGKTTYLTGFHISSAGATAAVIVSVTVTGTITGTLTYTYPCVAGVTTGNASLIVTPPIPIPASATNTTIAVSLPALGAGGTHASVVAYGYQV